MNVGIYFHHSGIVMLTDKIVLVVSLHSSLSFALLGKKRIQKSSTVGVFAQTRSLLSLDLQTFFLKIPYH